MNAASYVIVIIFAIRFFVRIYWDIEGRPAEAPRGFPGVLVTVVVYLFWFSMFYFAGLFEK